MIASEGLGIRAVAPARAKAAIARWSLRGLNISYLFSAGGLFLLTPTPTPSIRKRDSKSLVVAPLEDREASAFWAQAFSREPALCLSHDPRLDRPPPGPLLDGRRAPGQREPAPRGAGLPLPAGPDPGDPPGIPGL